MIPFLAILADPDEALTPIKETCPVDLLQSPEELSAMTPEEKRFIDGWQFAGSRLQQIRDQELRDLDEKKGAEMISRATQSNPDANGLAIFQSWMMRLRVLELLNRQSQQS